MKWPEAPHSDPATPSLSGSEEELLQFLAVSLIEG